ncbi:hypothetical protein OIU79_012181 [Salix purpurea]|uniref:Pentatricopeptide repeat-containing protein n=1 Tax=Salix purpurea TaxID=77065 RepID=A0A9Q0T382_SALPP|nr:hypothetical protein OIU79_012181 [Salix purpurea]
MASLAFTPTPTPNLDLSNSKAKPTKSLKKGRIQAAFKILTEMDRRKFPVGPDIYGLLLQGCLYDRALFMGLQIHSRIVKHGDSLATNEYLETKLFIFYAKCHLYEVANIFFYRLSVKNVFSWAAYIGLNCRMGFYREALMGLCEMIDSGILADNFVVPNILKACAAMQWITFGRGVHGYVVKMGFDRCVFVSSSLVDAYGKCGILEDARKVFDNMPDKNVVTWNSMIGSYVQNGFDVEAAQVFSDMRLEDVKPNQVTLLSFLSASANLGAVEEGKQAHAIAVLGGYELDSILGGSILNFYSKVGLIKDAELVFGMMLEKDAVAWNLLISSYVQYGQVEKALDLCHLMRLDNMRFDSVTLASILSACSIMGNIKLGKEGHCYCIRHNLVSDLAVANKLGKIGEALKLFYGMQLESVPPNVMSWNAVILGFIRNGQINEAQDMFSHMQAVGIHPNLMTFTTLIYGLVQNGFGNEAILVFQKMQECGIRANLPIIISTISACTDVASLQYGRAIHGYILRHALLSPIPVATALADMYSKCGNMDQARRVLV